MALPPCHRDFQFYIANGKISLHMNQRSADMFLGVPFNIASYSILLHMVAKETGYEVGEMIITLNDAHIYKDHYEAVEEQLKREPKEPPRLWLNPEVKSIFDYTMDDIKLIDYDPMPSIKAKMAV
jgi:thymidylate synthase